jgi:hypothetical protein
MFGNLCGEAFMIELEREMLKRERVICKTQQGLSKDIVPDSKPQTPLLKSLFSLNS